MSGRPKQFLLSPAVDRVINDLLDAGRREGNRLSRSDVVSGLIWQGRHLDGDALGVLVRACRRESSSDQSEVTGKLQPGPRPYSEHGEHG